LTSLEGSPREIYGNFECHDNRLTSLEGGPERVLNRYDCGHNQLTSLDGVPERVNGSFVEEIKIGVIPTIAHYLVPDMFGIWQESLTNVKLSIEEMKTTELIEAMEHKEIDIAILAGPHYDPRLRTIPLFNEEILIYCSTINGNEISLEELQNLHPWLLSKGNCLRTQMIHFCKLNDGVSDEWNYQGGNIDNFL
jgi:LysR family hydrogen peroxide-inducible transcriptional activator